MMEIVKLIFFVSKLTGRNKGVCMRRTLWTATILIFVIILPGICTAKTFTEDGYKISMKWRQSNDIFLVKGVVKEGKVCKQLNLSFNFRNLSDSTDSIVQIEARPISYHNTNGESFYAKGKVDFSIQFKNRWVVDSINLKCLR